VQSDQSYPLVACWACTQLQAFCRHGRRMQRHERLATSLHLWLLSSGTKST
jgi:hypothetical protein